MKNWRNIPYPANSDAKMQFLHSPSLTASSYSSITLIASPGLELTDYSRSTAINELYVGKFINVFNDHFHPDAVHHFSTFLFSFFEIQSVENCFWRICSNLILSLREEMYFFLWKWIFEYSISSNESKCIQLWKFTQCVRNNLLIYSNFQHAPSKNYVKEMFKFIIPKVYSKSSF